MSQFGRWVRRFFGARPEFGFKEYVKNPELFWEAARELEAAEAAPAARGNHLAGLVAAISRRPLELRERRQLEKAGAKAIPLLLAALRREDFPLRGYTWRVTDGSPLEMVLDLLEPFGLPELADLERALEHADDWLHGSIFYHLARCANDDAVPALQAGLRSGSEHCRTMVLIGLTSLRDSQRGSAAFRRALFEAALPLLTAATRGPSENPTSALLALDYQRAVAAVLADENFRPDNCRIDKFLAELKETGFPVPGPQLRALLSRMKDRATEYPFNYAYADGLTLLTWSEGAGAREVIEDALTWGDETVKTAAADAATVAAGVGDAFEFAFTRYDRDGSKRLSQEQLYYVTLTLLECEVRNGGFSQYFFNSSGDLAQYAVEAAKAVGAPLAAAVIQQAIALFGEGSPFSDRDTRINQLAEIDLEALDELNGEYYGCPDNLRILLPAYVARHPEAFKAAE